MSIYIETSVILASVEKGEFGERCVEFLNTLSLESTYLSELVLAEVHNLEEPRREWVARLLKKRPFAIYRVSTKAIELAEKYFFNKVIAPEHRDTGLHVAIASLYGCKTLYTWDKDYIISNQQGFSKINSIFGCSLPELILPFDDYEWKDKELYNIRALSYRVTSRKDKREITRGIKESCDFFLKEKKLTLDKVGKVEIF